MAEQHGRTPGRSERDDSPLSRDVGPRGSQDPFTGYAEIQQRGSPSSQSFGAASPRKGPKNYVRSDERIQENLCEQLAQTLHVDTSDVTVEVKGGKVTLYGTVPHRQMKHWIEDFVADYGGVTEVENKLRVAITAALPQDRNEPWR